MFMPTMDAEASLHPAMTHYHLVADRGSPAGAAVVPAQSCGFWKGLGCHWPIEACAPVCAADVLVGEDWCICMSSCLGSALGVPGCYDCVQSWFRC
jgi:hypothetical protein